MPPTCSSSGRQVRPHIRMAQTPPLRIAARGQRVLQTAGLFEVCSSRRWSAAVAQTGHRPFFSTATRRTSGPILCRPWNGLRLSARARYPRLQRRKAALQPARTAVFLLRNAITVYALVPVRVATPPGRKVSDAANNTMLGVTNNAHLTRCCCEHPRSIGANSARLTRHYCKASSGRSPSIGSSPSSPAASDSARANSSGSGASAPETKK